MQRIYVMLMFGKVPNLLTALSIPQGNRAISTSGGDPQAIRRKRHGTVTETPLNRISGEKRHVIGAPQTKRPIELRGCHQFTVCRMAYVVHSHVLRGAWSLR